MKSRPWNELSNLARAWMQRPLLGVADIIRAAGNKLVENSRISQLPLES